MLGIEIFLHSFRQVTGNIAMAARVSWWLVVIIAFESWLVFSNVGDGASEPSALVSVIATVNLIFIVWSLSLVCVVWHRYILLEEMPTKAIPYYRGLRVWRYIVGIFAIAFILFGVAIVLGVFVGLAINPESTFAAPIFGLLIGIAVTTLFFRLALILPSIALNEKMTIAAAFDLTKGFVKPIFGLVLATVVFNLGVNLILSLLFDASNGAKMIELTETGIVFTPEAGNLPLYLFVSGMLQWFVFMLNISILTTLYGHIVERRGIF